MNKTKYNIIAKCDTEKPYIILDMIATKLNKKQFEKLQEQNTKLLGNYRFINYNDTDFTWWGKIEKYLTNTKITKAYFDIDFYGNITKY